MCTSENNVTACELKDGTVVPKASSIWRPFELFPDDKRRAEDAAKNGLASAKKALEEGGWYGHTCRKTLENGTGYNYAILVGPEHGPECVKSCEEGIVEDGETKVSISDAVYVNDLTYTYVMLYTLCASSCPKGTVRHNETRKCLPVCKNTVVLKNGKTKVCVDDDVSDVGVEIVSGGGIGNGTGNGNAEANGYRFYQLVNGITTYYEKCPKLTIQGTYQCVDTCPEEYPIEFEGKLCLERCNSLVYQGSCVERCPSVLYEENGTCVSSCDDNYEANELYQCLQKSSPTGPKWQWIAVGCVAGLDVVVVAIALIYQMRKGGGCIFTDNNEKSTGKHVRSDYIA